MNLTFDASDFAALGNAWQVAPQIAREELGRAMLDSDLLLQGNLMVQLPAGAGNAAGLRGSIFREEHVLADNVLGMVATNTPYAPYIELGTKPHRPPIQPLMDWVEAKLGLHDREAKSVAFAISRSIGKRGTKANPIWEKVWLAAQEQIRRKFVDAIARISQRLARGEA